MKAAFQVSAIGFLFLVAVDFLLFRTGIYFQYVEPESTAGIVTVNLSVFDRAYRHGAGNVLVIGDSRVAQGFSPSIANKVGQSRNLNFIGIGMPGTTPRVWNYFLKRIDRESQPLRAVVLMTMSFQDGTDLENMNDRVLDINYALPLLRLNEVPEFVWSFHDNNARVRALRAIALPGLAMQSDLHAFLLSPTARIEKARQWNAHFAEVVNDYSGQTKRIPDIPLSALLARPFNPGAVPSDHAQWLTEYITNIRASPPSHLIEELAEYNRLWYGMIAERYAGRNIPVFVYQMPRGPFHKGLVGDQPARGILLELERARKLVLLGSEPFVDLEQPQFFFDFLHLNADGRKTFSERLAEMLMPLVSD